MGGKHGENRRQKFGGYNNYLAVIFVLVCMSIDAHTRLPAVWCYLQVLLTRLYHAAVKVEQAGTKMSVMVCGAIFFFERFFAIVLDDRFNVGAGRDNGHSNPALQAGRASSITLLLADTPL